MRSLVLQWAAASIAAGAFLDCAQQQHVAVRSAPVGTTAGQPTVGVTNAQPPPPAPNPLPAATPAPGTDEADQSSPADVNAPPQPRDATPPPTPSAEPDVNVTPPPYGVTEQQQPDRRTHAEQIVAQASQQIDRLRRMERSDAEANRAPRLDIDASLSDLGSKRERVLQVLREMEASSRGDGSQGSADLSAMLDADVADLEQAVRASFAVAPPPSQGLPQPSPLPPSDIR